MDIQMEMRQKWMATLAKGNLDQLETKVSEIGTLPEYSFIRPPEIGLTMVRGRAGGTGQVFNLGEMTITRCTVKIEEVIGFGYVAGRSYRHAELAALCDGLMQLPEWHDIVQSIVIEFLEAEASRKKEIQQCQTEATKVNFFTLARGDD
ncbi:MAG: phosphonate C-P lyase system protein PhnG [Okeania sp. SIO2F4]|uniref:phosphonate C-P lyase system protein PhnG n=1 Tax=Okeania sp. SIO2F4 TaxID=2607790 RepID=UPI00142B482D|nr:phosphonate C-P lyase system protein PhnG [Okeania sp. SIO2F4]NES06764.1 phosphonate C-P lyase system protein PhnG [Okeania sp. SIO2F4]